MREICSEDEYNDTYGRIRMYQVLVAESLRKESAFLVEEPYTG